jgi:hypothetical protein
VKSESESEEQGQAAHMDTPYVRAFPTWPANVQLYNEVGRQLRKCLEADVVHRTALR